MFPWIFSLVTTRTTSLTSVPHATFALRFSDLIEIEEACREDEERRATRLIDWMSGRINQKCARWVSEMEEPEAKGKERDTWRTPWWDEVRRCAEGDQVPSRHEGWSHPVASEFTSRGPREILNLWLHSYLGCVNDCAEPPPSHHSSSRQISSASSLGRW
jgi:hypothetical protein